MDWSMVLVTTRCVHHAGLAYSSTSCVWGMKSILLVVCHMVKKIGFSWQCIHIRLYISNALDLTGCHLDQVSQTRDRITDVSTIHCHQITHIKSTQWGEGVGGCSRKRAEG